MLARVLITVLMIFTVACGGPEDTVSTAPSVDTVGDLTGLPVVAMGNFAPANGYSVVGEVELFFNAPENVYSLVLDSFLSDNGPQLKVYLSQGVAAINILDLGDLRSTNGTLRYDFPAADFDPSFNYALIWCELVGQSFGEALLN